jgi:hypothetical protein
MVRVTSAWTSTMRVGSTKVISSRSPPRLNAQVREPPVGLEPTPALRRLYALRAFTLGHERPGDLWGLVDEARGGAKGFSLTLNSP